MKTTTSGYKSIIASGNARDYLIKIDLTLANNTVLHLTEADIWEDSFTIETASSGTSTFDIGSAVIGKCTFTINNIDGDFDNYDFFNATAVVWLGLKGDVVSSTQQYYRMGFFTVDEPQKANGLISLELLDYMWKFDVPLSGVTLNYPITAANAVLAICSYCGVTLAASSSSFHGSSFSIAEAPKDVDNMNCREMIQYIAMLGCNFCMMNDSGQLVIRWYDTTATASTTDVFDYNKSTSFGTEDITITGVKFVIDSTEYTIGTGTYRLELDNPLVTASNVSSVLNLIWDVLSGFTLRTYTCTTASDLAAEIGDKVKILDYQGNYVYSWITLNSFKLAGQQIQCNAESPNRTLVKRYSKTVQAAVEVARQQTEQIISNVELDMQLMNDLAVNAMGGYEDYEDIGTGGRVWYLSNMPITKSAQGVCSFEPNSTVFKVSGSGFFVSEDGGITWTNGYDSQTGKLVVNVLSAIGINFDWARGGTLTLGGYGNGNGILSILNSANVEKVHGDNTGIKVGATTGSKIHITTDGEFDYYYDNTYAGHMVMSAHNYGTQDNPDIRDTLMISEFNDEYISSTDSYSYIHLQTDPSTNKGSVRIYGETRSSGQIVSDAALGVSGDGIRLDGTVIYNGMTGVSPGLMVMDSSYRWVGLDFTHGGLTGYQQTQNIAPHSEWHSWHDSQDPSITYVAIILSEGVNQAVFPECTNDDNHAYEPYIKCASGQSPPKITDMVTSGTTITVSFTAVTAAQASGGACVIKLMEHILG